MKVTGMAFIHKLSTPEEVDRLQHFAKMRALQELEPCIRDGQSYYFSVSIETADYMHGTEYRVYIHIEKNRP